MILKDKETGYESRKYVCRLNFPFYDFFCYGLVKSCKNYSSKKDIFGEKSDLSIKEYRFCYNTTQEKKILSCWL